MIALREQMNQTVAPQSNRGHRRAPGILIADDEACIRQVLAWFLCREGFEVWVAENGLEATQLYFQDQADIDLILLDIDMPLLDGRRAARVLRWMNPQVRFCFMSGDLQQQLTEELLDLGPVWVFPKPFPVANVVQLLQHLVEVERARSMELH